MYQLSVFFFWFLFIKIDAKPEDRSVPIQEIGGKIDHHRQLCQLLQQLPEPDVHLQKLAKAKPEQPNV